MKIKGTYDINGIKHRVCGFCKKHKTLTEENFHKDTSRTLGFMYECKECSSLRIDLRKHRNRKLTNEQRQAIKNRKSKYFKTKIGKAAALAYSYKKTDKAKGLICDITKEYIFNNIFTEPCFYCGDTESQMGCDRKDNTKGHTRNNVVPCCRICNTARMHNFTHEEMKIVGNAIAQVRANRTSQLSTLE